MKLNLQCPTLQQSQIRRIVPAPDPKYCANFNLGYLEAVSVVAGVEELVNLRQIKARAVLMDSNSQHTVALGYLVVVGEVEEDKAEVEGTMSKITIHHRQQANIKPIQAVLEEG